MDMEKNENYCEKVRDDDYKGMIPGVEDGKVYHFHDDKHQEPYYKVLFEQKCDTPPEAKISPVVELFWKDCEHLSNSGTHTLYVVVKNPYSGIHLKNVKVILKDLDYDDKDPGTNTDGGVPILPDGCPAVELKPRHSISFGDLAPCHEEGDSASREVVLFARCAPHKGFFKVGAYSCFEVEFSGKHEMCFELHKCGC